LAVSFEYGHILAVFGRISLKFGRIHCIIGRIMKTQEEKKQLLLSVLQARDAPVSLLELMPLLGPDFSDRSVRRWLSEMTEQHLVIKTGQKRGTLYQARLATKGLIFSPAAQAEVDRISKPLFERPPVTYHKDWLEQYEPNTTFYLSAEHLSFLQSCGQRDFAHDPAGTYAKKIYNRLLIDLSYNSSRLEGNTYSLLDTEKLILEGVVNEDKLDEEKIMILNHKETIRHLVDSIGKIHVDFNEICTLHYLLSDGLVPNQYAGKLRDHGVRISASTYVPLENKALLEKQLTIICQKATNISNPFEQSFFLLVHLAYLQAFTDVNKRTSRLSSNIPLIKQNLVPLSFNAINKEEYTSATLAVYELNNTMPLEDLYCFSYGKSCQEYDVTVDSLGFDEVRVRFRRQRRDVVQQIVLRLLKGTAQKSFIREQAQQFIPSKYQARFINCIEEDLQEISPQRIIGMGITLEQLEQWQRKLQKRV